MITPVNAILNPKEKMKKYGFLILVMFFAVMELFATTYYVSPTGAGSGTMNSPMSFSTAISKSLTAGDSIILRGGMYSISTKQSLTKSGNATSYIHIIAYSDEIPVLDFRNETYGSSYPGVSISGNYVHVKGITIQGAGDNGMIVTGSYNFIENCTFRWNCDSGLQLKTGSNNYVLNCDSYENFDYMTGSLTSPDFGGNADGFADKQYTHSGTNRFKACRSWLNSDDGWDHYQKVGNTVFDSCWCYANGPATFDMKKNIRFKKDSAIWFKNFAGSNYVITNYGNGNGFKLGGDYTAHNATLYNCVSVKNKVKGFDQNNNNGQMNIYNCTGYSNLPDFGFSNTSYGSIDVKNCASLASRSSNKLTTKIVSTSTNTWDPGFSCSTSDFESVDYTQILLPRQTDGSLPEMSFLHLKAGSGMIDKGLILGYSFEGSAPDLGAFEYKVSTGTELLQNTQQIVFDPRSGILTAKSDLMNINIYDLQGKNLLFNQKLRALSTISVSDLPASIYLISIQDPSGKNQVMKIRTNQL